MLVEESSFPRTCTALWAMEPWERFPPQCPGFSGATFPSAHIPQLEERAGGARRWLFTSEMRGKGSREEAAEASLSGWLRGWCFFVRWALIGCIHLLGREMELMLSPDGSEVTGAWRLKEIVRLYG